MNHLQYYLTMLSEESSEIIKECAKSQRFGLLSEHPDTGVANHENIKAELNDLLAIVECLNEEYNLGFTPCREAIDAKKRKMALFLQYSVEEGYVTMDVPEKMYPKK